MTDEKALTSPTTRQLLADPGRAAGELAAKFPRDLANPAAAREFVAVAVTYDLDPFMGDVVPYQGRPFVTEHGWLRLVGRHAPGQLVKLTSRQANAAERKEVNCSEGDVLAIGEVRRSYPAADGGGQLDVARRGRVRESEIKALHIDPNKRGHTPLEVDPHEMAETRARRRALRTAFRDVLTMQGLPHVDEETGEIIEGSAVVLPDAGKSADPTSAARLTEEANRARGELYAKAERLGLKSKTALHAALRLVCKGMPAEAHLEAEADPAECHKLRESIEHLERQGKIAAEAWEIMSERLPEGPPTTEADVTRTDEPEAEPAPFEGV